MYIKRGISLLERTRHVIEVAKYLFDKQHVYSASRIVLEIDHKSGRIE